MFSRRFKWLICFLLLTFYVSSLGLYADTDWDEMAQLVEQADEIINRQAQELQTLNHSIEKLTQQLQQQSKAMQEQQKQIRKQKLLLTGCGVLLTGTVALMLVREIKQ